jgi:SAM-dependent methyltransferase
MSTRGSIAMAGIVRLFPPPTCEARGIFERSADLYDLVYGFKDYAGEALRLDELIRERRPAARSLLDVACGTGKHLAELSDRYPDVAGLDLDERLLEVARERLPDVTFHLADMTSFDLGRRFDVVTCLFSAIGYAGTEPKLRAAIETMARHLESGGVLIVEPWLEPQDWRPGHLHLLTVDEPDIKIARASVADQEGDVSIVDFHYLVVTRGGVRHFTERHEVTLFTRSQYLGAFEAAGLEVEHDEEGLIGRGLYIGLAS